MEKPVRSLLKAASWRIIATLTTTLLVFVFTQDIVISVGVGGSEFFLKIFVYYLHERVWNHFRFGREQKPK